MRAELDGGGRFGFPGDPIGKLPLMVVFLAQLSLEMDGRPSDLSAFAKKRETNEKPPLLCWSYSPWPNFGESVASGLCKAPRRVLKLVSIKFNFRSDADRRWHLWSDWKFKPVRVWFITKNCNFDFSEERLRWSHINGKISFLAA